jgi:hypothetical protein
MTFKPCFLSILMGDKRNLRSCVPEDSAWFPIDIENFLDHEQSFDRTSLVTSETGCQYLVIRLILPLPRGGGNTSFLEPACASFSPFPAIFFWVWNSPLRYGCPLLYIARGLINLFAQVSLIILPCSTPRTLHLQCIGQQFAIFPIST